MEATAIATPPKIKPEVQELLAFLSQTGPSLRIALPKSANRTVLIMAFNAGFIELGRKDYTLYYGAESKLQGHSTNRNSAVEEIIKKCPECQKSHDPKILLCSCGVELGVETVVTILKPPLVSVSNEESWHHRNKANHGRKPIADILKDDDNEQDNRLKLRVRLSDLGYEYLT